MRAEIITIGDELLIGQVVDTNSAFMAEELNKVGIELYQITSVHDDAAHIAAAVMEALSQVDVVITTGGLGPTKDDITKHVLCELMGGHLVPDKSVEAHIRDLYKDRPAVLNRLTETQWLVPDNCTVLPNRVGSAPLMYWQTQEGKQLFSLPGVPFEMETAMREQVLPILAQGQTAQITHRTIVVSGIPESALAIHIEAFENALPENIHLAYLPKNHTIRLRLSGYGVPAEAVEAEQRKLIALTKQWLIATEDKPLEVLVGEKLKALGKTIATAESCTGGKLAMLLNKHAGSSVFYKGSVVAYSNEVKENVLKVNREYLEKYGAVSEQVVALMAFGAMKLLNTDFAVATSGVAGPDGGTPEKPVGTVWIAIASKESVYTECLHLRGDRNTITDTAATLVLVRLLPRLA